MTVKSDRELWEVKYYDDLSISDKERLASLADKVTAKQIRELTEYKKLSVESADWKKSHRGILATSPAFNKQIELYMDRYTDNLKAEVLKEYPHLAGKRVDNRHIWEMTKDELMHLPLFAHKFGRTYDDYYDDYKAIGWVEGWQYNKTPGYVDKTGYKGVLKLAKDTGLSAQKESDLRSIHNARSTRSKESDERQSNADTIEPDDPKVERWLRDPGSADVRGIDTPRKVRVSTQTSTQIRRVRG